MNSLRERLAASPLAARVVPFIVFTAFTVGQGNFGESSRYWAYFVKTLVGAWLIWLVRPLVSEMKWKFSWEALVVGIAVFAMWVGIDPFYPPLDRLLSYADAVRLGGRGGAGFPFASKLRSLAGGPRHIVVNGSESEPASRKDRVLMLRAPHLVLDGVLAVAHAAGARRVTAAVHDPASPDRNCPEMAIKGVSG